MVLTGPVLRTLLALYPNGCDVVEGRAEGHVHAQSLVERDHGKWEPVNEYDDVRSPFTHKSSESPSSRERLKPCLVGSVVPNTSPPEAGALGIARDTYFGLPDEAVGKRAAP